MLFSVGYSVKSNNKKFIDLIIKNKEKINEVYFTLGRQPSGRDIDLIHGHLIPSLSISRQLEDLTRLSKTGISLNLLFNANCYGANARSKALFKSISADIEYVKEHFSIQAVTTTSPLIAKFIKNHYPDLDVRASVNIGIGSICAADALADVFDSFYIKRELNRNFKVLQELRTWCNQNDKQMYLLANSGCLNNCPVTIFHNNLVAHNHEIATKDNSYSFGQLCNTYLRKKDKQQTIFTDTNFICPEDVHLYEDLVPAMKLATRVTPYYEEIIQTYLNEDYSDNFMKLLEPPHDQDLLPFVWNNQTVISKIEDEKLKYFPISI